jgi:hypothetical protein
MAGYSSRQSTFTTGDTITAAHSNNEFNAVLAAFHVSTGHKHDGSTAGDGGPISTLFSNAVSMGTGADTDIALTFNANSNDGVITWMEDEDYFQFSDDVLISTTEKILFRDTAIYINSSTDGQLDIVADTEIQIAATTIDMNGNVDISGSLTLGGTAITSTAAELNIMDGGTSATSTTVADADRVVYNDAGTMKQVAVTDLDTYISATSKTLTNKTLTSPVLNTGVSGTAVLDEDNMASNSATQLATQQSIKAYVDATVTAEDLDVTSDSGTIAIDLDSETLTIAGGTGLASSATSNTVTLAIDSTVATLTGSQTLTNKTLTSPVLDTGVSGTAVADEDNMSSNSATKLATQQSIKAYVDGQVSGVSTTWTLEDDDGTEVAVASGKEVKFIGSGVTTNWTDTDNGTDADPYDLTFTVDAAQTGITSLLAANIKIGEDNETKIDFETANEIHFYANNTEQVYLADNIFGPQSDSDVDLGTTGVRWKDAFIDTVTTTGAVTVGGDLTVNGTTTTVNSTTVTIDDPIFTLGGDSAPGSDDNKDRGIEFRWHNGSAAKVGFFGYDDNAAAFTFVPDATNSSEVFSGTVGNAIFGNITGTLQTAAQTNITSTGALDGGSITSGFGTINTGASAITTTGLISGGSLDIDNVLINGTTIGHTDDTDLLTLADGALTVAGTIEATGNITGTLATGAQTNITSTGALGGGSIAAGFGAIDNGTSGIRTNIFTAETSVVPDASGGADLGTTSLEWGNLYIADDKKIALGSDQNFTIEYDEDGNDTTAVVAATGLSLAPHGTSAGNGTELRFQELAANGAHYVGFKAPDSVAANKVFILPNADGSADQVLKTDGSLALDWVDQAGGGSIDLVADGNIAAGKPVILTSAGKAQQIAQVTAVNTTPTVRHDVTDGADVETAVSAMAYEETVGRYIAVYRDTGNSNALTAIVGTWSSGDISWATPVVLDGNGVRSSPAITAGEGTIAVFYAGSDDPHARLRTYDIAANGTISEEDNKSIVSGTAFTGGFWGQKIRYSPNSNMYCLVYSDRSSGSDEGFAHMLSLNVSNHTITTIGARVKLEDTNFHVSRATLIHDPDTDRFLYATFNGAESDDGYAWVIAPGGTAGSPTVAAGTKTRFNSNADNNVGYVVSAYDQVNNKVMLIYADSTADVNKGVIGTITAGTNAVAFAGDATINSANDYNNMEAAYDVAAAKIIFFYRDGGNSNHLTYRVITPGASSFSVSDAAVIKNTDQRFSDGMAAEGASGEGTALLVQDNGNSNTVSFATAYFETATTTNITSTNFLGLATSSISDTATGTITTLSGINPNQSSLTIGTKYYATVTGTLATSSTGNREVGVAVATDKVLITSVFA